MGWLWKTKTSSTKPDYTDVQYTTASSTLPVPLIYGTARVAPNIVWYTNFQAHAESSGGGGKGGGSSSSASGYTYSADMILAIGEGPIASVGTVWDGNSTYTLSGKGLSLWLGASDQTVWTYLATSDADEALAYQWTAYAAAASYDLGTSASIGSLNFEAVGLLSASGVKTSGLADPVAVAADYLSNAQHGLGFETDWIDSASWYSNANAWQNLLPGARYRIRHRLIEPGEGQRYPGPLGAAHQYGGVLVGDGAQGHSLWRRERDRQRLYLHAGSDLGPQPGRRRLRLSGRRGSGGGHPHRCHRRAQSHHPRMVQPEQQLQ